MNYCLLALLTIVFALFPQSGFSAAAPSTGTRSFTLSAIASTINSVGIPTVTFYMTNFDELKQAVLLTGRLLGPDETKRAEEWTKSFDAKLSNTSRVLSTSRLAINQRSCTSWAFRRSGLTARGALLTRGFKRQGA
jgi:hypothetical protein